MLNVYYVKFVLRVRTSDINPEFVRFEGLNEMNSRDARGKYSKPEARVNGIDAVSDKIDSKLLVYYIYGDIYVGGRRPARFF